MTNETIFYTQVVSIVSFVGALFVLYRLLVSQKDAVIEVLKERLASEIDKVNQLKTQTPDALVAALNDRVKVMASELERLRSDSSSAVNDITAKENEIGSVRAQLVNLADLIQGSDLVCPECGGHLVERTYEPIWMHGIEGQTLEDEIEMREYECGARFRANSQTAPCPNANAEQGEDDQAAAAVKSRP